MKKTQKEVKRYLKELYRLMPASGKKKKQFVTRFEESMGDFLSTSEDIDYDKLVDYFGKPNYVIELYTNEWNFELKEENIKRRTIYKFIFYICGLIIIICLALLASNFIQAFINEVGCHESIY